MQARVEEFKKQSLMESVDSLSEADVVQLFGPLETRLMNGEVLHGMCLLHPTPTLSRQTGIAEAGSQVAGPRDQNRKNSPPLSVCLRVCVCLSLLLRWLVGFGFSDGGYRYGHVF